MVAGCGGVNLGAGAGAACAVTVVGRWVGATPEAAGVALMPHSPYFGPGWLATLHLMAALPKSGLIERLFVDLEASAFGDLVDPIDGQLRVPDGPGLGAEPDPDFVKTYRVTAG